jgi:hypothetical protein
MRWWNYTVLGGLAMACLVMSTGCATVLSGTRQNVTVQSEPPGAMIRMGGVTGLAPSTFSVEKGEDLVAEVRYNQRRQVVPLTRRFDPISLLNLLCPPLFIVDAVTGAWTEYEPDTYQVIFQAPPAEGRPRVGQ